VERVRRRACGEALVATVNRPSRRPYSFSIIETRTSYESNNSLRLGGKRMQGKNLPDLGVKLGSFPRADNIIDDAKP
jgi:hypothetical protein